MNGGTVLGIFQPPSREDSLRAISRALLRIRSKGWTLAALGKELDCHADTIKAASDEESLLNFDCVARLAFKFPEEFEMIEALWTCSAPAVPTAADRLERISNEVDAIRRELGE